MDVSLVEYFLTTPIGFKLNIKQMSKNSYISSTRLINSVNKNEFFSLIDEDDVDFMIEFDNRMGCRGIRITIIINEKNYSFYISPGQLSTLETLENNGKKLHFKSQYTEDGQLFVASIADKYGLSYDLASINCSKIAFSIDVEKKKEGFTLSKAICRGEIISVNIETLFGRINSFFIGKENTIADLKKRYAGIENISDRMDLIFNSKILDDDVKLKSYEIENNSTLYVSNLIYDSRQTAFKPNHGFRPFCDIGGCLSDGIGTMSLNSLGANNFNTQKTLKSLCRPTSLTTEYHGRKGVICYGEDSNQKFTTVTGFIEDRNFQINDFVILMRITSENYVI